MTASMHLHLRIRIRHGKLSLSFSFDFATDGSIFKTNHITYIPNQSGHKSSVSSVLCVVLSFTTYEDCEKYPATLTAAVFLNE